MTTRRIPTASGEETGAPELSVVVPIYNEEGSVGPLCEAIRAALDPAAASYEVVLVDDGSTDATLERLRREREADPRVRVVALSRNSGQTAAMAAGFRHARGRVIVSMDGDLQNDPADIPLLVRKLEEGCDVVCGWRKDRQDTFVSRTLPSKIANRLIAWMTGIPIHDNGCSLKAYRAEVIRSLNLYSEMHRFLPALSAMTGARIAEVVVRHHPRVHGRSKYGISRTFKVLGDMIVIKMVTQFASRPGRWFGLLSLPWLVLGGAALAGWLGGLWVAGRTGTVVLSSLAVLFFYLFGHMLMLAILSETFLATADRRYLRRLARILTVGHDLASFRRGRHGQGVSG
jgi:glycosyltransferase involved in cell wall biosynthesis